MDLEKCLEKINENREQIEAPFVFCFWKDPDLYDDYKFVNDKKDETLKSKDAQFYFNLGKALYDAGFRKFDNITVYGFLQNKPNVKETFEDYGGYREVENLKQLVNVENVDAYFDKIAKLNTLEALCELTFNSFEDISKFDKMSSQQVYDYFEYKLNDISITSTHDVEEESLVIDDEFIEECNTGDAVGISYAKNCPIMNYLTLGVPLGEMFMIAGHSGVGKSSFVFENMVLPMTEEGVKVAIVSNEMRSKDYKIMLLAHILTKELNYWGLTRKQIKMGHFTNEQREMLNKAKKISQEKYSSLGFIKLFDNDIGKVLKYIKKKSKRGYQIFVWDTMKSDDSLDEKMFLQLLINSRKVFQLASKENIAIIPTYQLALYTVNQRYLDASCLANGKQIKEVFSEMIYMRQLWQDEYTGEKYDCKAYQLQKNEDGKYTKVKRMIELDKDKKYIVAFLDKTRNDEDKQQVLYEVNGRFNSWKEIGYCNILNEHKGF
nr:MAG TPA: replicative helicase [Caudoviricetes sp.]